MAKLIRLPHEVHESTCYVNGLFDILAWRGARYDYFLLPLVGGMASFAYLKFKSASPPCMVYWGNCPKYLMRDLSSVIGFTQLVSEGKSFKKEFPKMKEYLDNNQPVMVGALDMYYLHYYPELYRKEHVPIHYLLMVGYDDDKKVVYVHDCGVVGIQEIPYHDFERSLDVNVPGLSKKNSYRVFTLPKTLISERELAEKGFTHKAEHMLKPPVSLFGIPAMSKLAKEITGWSDKECFKHMVAYAGLTPPFVSDDLSHNDAMRLEQARVLNELGVKYDKKSWVDASRLFKKSAEFIIRLCGEAIKFDGGACAKSLAEIARMEENAYNLLLTG